MLLTRALPESREIAGVLEQSGIASEIWPLTRIVLCGGPVEPPAGTDGLLATSAHGIRSLAAGTPRRDLPVLAVGARTADVARGLGFGAVLSADGDAAALALLVRASGLRRLFHPRGAETAGDLPGRLADRGIAVIERVVYAAEPAGPAPAPVAHALAAGRVAVGTLWSARHAEILCDRLAPAAAPATRWLAISERAAAPLHAAGFSTVEASPRPDRAAMLDRLRELLPPF
ncbi:MAG: uroporphyrinogen-III synthase [Paracoccaceae bacterium]